MHIIGLTGGIGSGKSEAAKIFSSLGAKIIDLDVIAHDLTTKNALGYSLIIEKFGDDFLNKKKEIDRKTNWKGQSQATHAHNLAGMYLLTNTTRPSRKRGGDEDKRQRERETKT